MPKEESRRVRCEIRRVFVEIWDPIRVMDDPTWPRDEYDTYIGRIFELLTSKASDEEINQYLVACAAHMGMDASRHSHRDVIEALRRIAV
ncbi:MAG: hypothetical protein JSS95_10195 [Acidobacteria bacterium]|nr:hypothetical protein [Acidobacteriota bacterium]